MNRKDRFRVGILGYGFIGKVHAYAYRTLPFYYDPVPVETEIACVVSGRRETAGKARQALGAESAGTDYRMVTEDPDIDIVHVCTPNAAHKDALLSAIAHQKHIYCDKPLVATWQEAEEVAGALAGYRGTSQMTFQNRFFPATIAARSLVDQGAVGRVLGFRAAYLHGGSADPQAPLKWKLSGAAGGGVIADLGSHTLDFLEFLAGRISRLVATTHVAYSQRPAVEAPDRQVPVDAEDAVSILARLESGAMGTLEATKIATGSEDELRCEIEGSLGALRFNLMDPHHLEYYDAQAAFLGAEGLRGWTRLDTGQRYAAPATKFPSPKASIGWLRAHVASLANFLQAVAENRSTEPDLRSGVRVERLMEAVRRSTAEDRWIKV